MKSFNKHVNFAQIIGTMNSPTNEAVLSKVTKTEWYLAYRYYRRYIRPNLIFKLNQL